MHGKVGKIKLYIKAKKNIVILFSSVLLIALVAIIVFLNKKDNNNVNTSSNNQTEVEAPVAECTQISQQLIEQQKSSPSTVYSQLAAQPLEKGHCSDYRQYAKLNDQQKLQQYSANLTLARQAQAAGNTAEGVQFAKTALAASNSINYTERNNIQRNSPSFTTDEDEMVKIIILSQDDGKKNNAQ